MAVLSAGYLIDGALQNGKVVRNVSVAGEDVGGLNRPEMLAQVKRLAEGFPDTPVSITADDLILNTTAGDLGYEIDVNTTVDRVRSGSSGLQPGQSGAVVVQPVRGVPVARGPDDRPGPVELHRAGP